MKSNTGNEFQGNISFLKAINNIKINKIIINK